MIDRVLGVDALASVVHLRNVTWQRDAAPILNDVSWTVERGEHWAIVGENGAGKTTLLEIVNGYIWPSSGTVEVLGHRLGRVDVRQLRRRIGWVTSTIAERVRLARPGQTARDVVISGRHGAIVLPQRRAADDDARAASLLASFGVERLALQPFRLLSQGERQRVLIARALMAEPQLLILDEPCTGLDLRARERLLATIQELGTRPGGPTCVYVTHHVEEVLPVFSHALLLKGGRVAAADKKEDVITGGLLSRLFEVDVDVRWAGGRPWLTVL